MTFFRYKADRWPYAVFLTYFLLDLAVFFTATDPVTPVLWFVVGVIPKSFICAFNHHHQHLPTFYQPLLNRAAEFMFGFQTGVVGYAWYLHHSRGHHEHYLDQKLDESKWMREDGTMMGEWEYTLITTLTAYTRAWEVGKRFPKKRAAFAAMILLNFGTLAAMFVHNWYNALFVFALPMLVSITITVWVTYYHHRGLDTGDHFSGSYNITGYKFNRFTGNLGYHTAHHYRPGVHWSMLPELHEQIKDKIPAHCYRDGAVLSGFTARRKAKKERDRKRKERRRSGGKPNLEPALGALSTASKAPELDGELPPMVETPNPTTAEASL